MLKLMKWSETLLRPRCACCANTARNPSSTVDSDPSHQCVLCHKEHNVMDEYDDDDEWNSSFVNPKRRQPSGRPPLFIRTNSSGAESTSSRPRRDWNADRQQTEEPTDFQFIAHSIESPRSFMDWSDGTVPPPPAYTAGDFDSQSSTSYLPTVTEVDVDDQHLHMGVPLFSPLSSMNAPRVPRAIHESLSSASSIPPPPPSLPRPIGGLRSSNSSSRSYFSDWRFVEAQVQEQERPERQSRSKLVDLVSPPLPVDRRLLRKLNILSPSAHSTTSSIPPPPPPYRTTSSDGLDLDTPPPPPPRHLRTDTSVNLPLDSNLLVRLGIYSPSAQSSQSIPPPPSTIHPDAPPAYRRVSSRTSSVPHWTVAEAQLLRDEMSVMEQGNLSQARMDHDIFSPPLPVDRRLLKRMNLMSPSVLSTSSSAPPPPPPPEEVEPGPAGREQATGYGRKSSRVYSFVSAKERSSKWAGTSAASVHSSTPSTRSGANEGPAAFVGTDSETTFVSVAPLLDDEQRQALEELERGVWRAEEARVALQRGSVIGPLTLSVRRSPRTSGRILSPPSIESSGRPPRTSCRSLSPTFITADSEPAVQEMKRIACSVEELRAKIDRLRT